MNPIDRRLCGSCSALAAFVCALPAHGQQCEPYWAHISTPTHSIVAGLGAFDDGTGTALYLGGCFGWGTSIYKWSGAEWLPLGSQGFPPNVYCTGAPTVLDGGDGPHIYTGAVGQVEGANVGGYYKWNGAAWEQQSPLMSDQLHQPLGSFDRGGGSRICCARGHD